MNLFQQAPPANLSPLISIVTVQEQEAPPVVEYTIEQKIKDNFYKCNEEIEYIRADNAECLAKPLRTAQYTVSREKTAKSTVNASSGWYPYGQCTEWIARNRSVGQWHNASQWLREARADGWATGSTPVVGAIAWESNHVSLVTSVNGDGTITVSEQNYKGFGVVSTRTAPASQFSYIY